MSDKKNPTTDSITPIVPGAEWIEREMMDFWGVTFNGHPKPEPLLIKNHPNYEKRKNQFRFNGVENE
jgi:NADH-quinone oxidoreductase subunit C